MIKAVTQNSFSDSVERRKSEVADFKVSTGRLGRDAETIEGYVRQIKNSLNELISYAGELSGMWKGPASEAFNKAVNDDLEALSTMTANLDKVHGYGNTAKEKYERCEAQVSDVVSGMR